MNRDELLIEELGGLLPSSSTNTIIKKKWFSLQNIFGSSVSSSSSSVVFINNRSNISISNTFYVSIYKYYINGGIKAYILKYIIRIFLLLFSITGIYIFSNIFNINSIFLNTFLIGNFT